MTDPSLIKITALPALSSVTAEDVFIVVDTSDQTDGPTGTDKQLTFQQLINSFPGGSIGTFDPSAVHSGDTASGDLTGTYPNPQIAAGAVTLTDMANLPGNTMIGNNTSGLAAPASMAPADVLAFLGLGPISAPVPIANGGTGQASANSALNALLPSQASNSGKFLQSNGTNTSWIAATSTLAGATDANISGPANTDTLQYLTSDNKWHNVTASTFRTNIGLGTSATHAATDFLQLAGNDNDTGQSNAGGVQFVSSRSFGAAPSGFGGSPLYVKQDNTVTATGVFLPVTAYTNPYFSVSNPAYGTVPQGPRAIETLEGTTTLNASSGISGSMPGLWYSWYTYKNQASQARNMGGNVLFQLQYQWLADGATATVTAIPDVCAPNIASEYLTTTFKGWWGFIDNPWHGTVNSGGQLAGSTAMSAGFVGLAMFMGNTQWGTRYDFWAREAWISAGVGTQTGNTPTLATHVGLYMEPFTAASKNLSLTLNNASVLLDKDRTFTAAPFGDAGSVGVGAAFAIQNNYTLDFTNATIGNFYQFNGTAVSLRTNGSGFGMGGVASWNPVFKNAKRTVTDSVTNGTTTVTSATAKFTARDVGATVTGTNIPASSTISSVTNATTIVITPSVASGSGSGGTLNIIANANLSLTNAFYAAQAYEADTVTIHGGASIDFYSNPLYTTVNSGTLSATSTGHTAFQSSITVNSGANMLSRIGFYAAEATGTGVSGIASEFGLYCESLVGGATKNAAVYLDGSTGTAFTAGTYGLYSRSATSYHGGVLQLDGQLNLVVNNPTYTASQTQINVSSAWTYQTTASMFNEFIQYAPTQTWTVQPLTATLMDQVFNNGASYKNGSSASINLSPVLSFVAAYTKTLDTQTGKNIGSGSGDIDFASAATYTVANSGTFTSGAHTAFRSLTVVNGASSTLASDTGFSYGLTATAGTITTATALKVNDATGSGAVTTQVGVDIAQLTKGTTNIGFRNAGSTVFTPTVVTVTSNACTVPVTITNAKITQTAAAGLTITMATGNAVDGQRIRCRIYPFTNAAQTITWNNTLNSTAIAPTSTSAVTTTAVTAEFEWDAVASKWLCVLA